MNAIALPFYRRPLSCHYRPLILAVTAATLFSAFWFLSRYPQLLDKAHHLGEVLPSMAFNHEAIHVDVGAPAWQRILAGAANWFDSMKLVPCRPLAA